MKKRNKPELATIHHQESEELMKRKPSQSGSMLSEPESLKLIHELKVYQIEMELRNEEKEKRAAELIIANKELAFQNMEKEKRAAELIIANKKLSFQNREKEKRAAELISANKELAIQYESSQHLAAIVESSEDAIVSKSLDGTIKSWNLAAEKMFGYTDIQAIGQNISLIIPPEFIQDEITILDKIQNSKIIEHYETVRMKKSGEKFHVSLTVSPIKDNEGEITGVSKIVRDITDRKQAEEELKKHRKHLEEMVNERTAQLADVVSNLERSNKELEQFAYVASHDLQEPLRMVSSYTQLLEKRYKDKLDQDANDFIQFAVDGANRMQKLINDLLDYSRITSRGKEFTKVDISQVLGQVISNLQELIIENTALITNNDLPEVMADESQILRVFQNLIQNALKFKNRSELTKIHISCKKKNDFYEFAISDNGIGIDMQYHDRIFTIFQRLHTKEEYPGTGIGLSICKRIIERHGGKIWFESKVNEGTTFYFTLSSLS